MCDVVQQFSSCILSPIKTAWFQSKRSPKRLFIKHLETLLKAVIFTQKTFSYILANTFCSETAKRICLVMASSCHAFFWKCKSVDYSFTGDFKLPLCVSVSNLEMNPTILWVKVFTGSIIYWKSKEEKCRSIGEATLLYLFPFSFLQNLTLKFLCHVLNKLGNSVPIKGCKKGQYICVCINSLATDNPKA